MSDRGDGRGDGNSAASAIVATLAAGDEYKRALSEIGDRCRLVAMRFSRDYRCVFISRGASKVLGRATEELLGASIGEVLGGSREVWKGYQRSLEHVFNSGEVAECQFEVRSPAGIKEYFGIFVPESRGSHGESTTESVAGVALDITTHRQAIERLKEANQRKDRFLAIVAHEMRNPLSAILSGLRLLELGSNGQSADETREMMNRQLRHLSGLVNDLLDVARIGDGRILVQKKRVALGDVFNLALDACRDSIATGKHTLNLDLPGGEVYIIGDLNRLAQVITNLLDNASKYTPKGGQITLSARCTERAVDIKVADNGFGIPADRLEHIFEMFTQLEGSLANSRGGLGIGLYLVKMIVEAHAGLIKVASDGEGKGSCFTVSLPWAPPSGYEEYFSGGAGSGSGLVSERSPCCTVYAPKRKVGY